MAVYRPHPRLLKRQIESLRMQSVASWSCIIGLDGPDSEASTLVNCLVDGDERFDVREYAEAVGAYRHFERLLAEVPWDAAWVALADQDDYWYPDKFRHLLGVLTDRPDLSAVTGQATLVDEKGARLGRTRRRPGDLTQTLIHNQFTGSLVVFRRVVLDIARPFPPETDIAVHDHWLGACAATLGAIGLYDEPVQDYVQHRNNLLGERAPRNIRDAWREVLANGGLSHYLDHASVHQWGWRVAMARALMERGAVGQDPSVLALQRGYLSIRTVLIVAGSLLQGRLSIAGAVGMLACSAWWPLMKQSVKR